jgi:hypothetical protein
MATAAQIAANQRNALKSTGPKSQKGKEMSSVNARRHGMHSALPVKEVLAAYQVITGKKATDVAQISGVALRLAMAEAQLARVKESERAVLARGDDQLRDVQIFDLIDDLLMSEYAEHGKISSKTALEASLLKLRASKVFEGAARNTYRSVLRALRQAENAQAAALDEWLGEA